MDHETSEEASVRQKSVSDPDNARIDAYIFFLMRLHYRTIAGLAAMKIPPPAIELPDVSLPLPSRGSPDAHIPSK
jgi:hypothetical protein